MQGEAAAWRVGDYLAAATADATRQLLWAFIEVHRDPKRSKALPQPEPLPRPALPRRQAAQERPRPGSAQVIAILQAKGLPIHAAS